MASLVEVKARHEAELAAFEEEAATLRAGASKKKRAQVNFEVDQRRSDLEYRHAQELAALDAGDDGGDDDDAATVDAAAAPTAAEAAAAREAAERAAAAKKRAKAAKKRGKRADKARAATAASAERDAEAAELAKNSERAAELAAIDAKLAAEGRRVHEVAADGHCLYRAVAHQLGSETHADLRRACADYMEARPGDFAAFAVPDGDAGAFAAYCQAVRATAEWGGQVELLALCRALGRPIRVVARDGADVAMGEDEAGGELVVAYHRHYYALGEHYNSTSPLP